MRREIIKLGLLMLSLCSTLLLNAQCVEYDKSVDLLKYNTFNFKEGEILHNGNKINNSAEFDLIKNQIIAELQSKGLKYSDENPDIEMSFIMETEKDSTVERVPPIPYLYGRGNWTEGGYEVSDTQGLLIVDLKDSKTDKTVWRSGNAHRVKHKNRHKYVKRSKKNVEKALVYYPKK